MILTNFGAIVTPPDPITIMGPGCDTVPVDPVLAHLDAMVEAHRDEREATTKAVDRSIFNFLERTLHTEPSPA